MIKRLLTTLAVLTMMTAFAMAQLEPLINSGTITNKGTIKVGCNDTGAGAESILNQATGKIANDATGVIEFTGDNPLFVNVTVGNVTNDGTIQFDGLITKDVMNGLGTDPATDRVGGLVLYNGLAASTGDQRIQGDVYYTNLTLAGAGLKTYNDDELNYYVSGEYLASGGNRTYGSSIFHYDGTDQTIFAETATDFTSGIVNYYNNLQLDGIGTKTILTGTSILVSTILGDLATAAVTMEEASKFILNDGIVASIAGDITGTGATIQLLGSGTTGTFDVATTGSITFNAGTAASLFEMDGATVNNSGAMTFNDGKYDQKSGITNLIVGSTLLLNGGDFIQTLGLVNIAGTMTVTSGTFDINGTDATTDLITIDAGGLLELTASAGVIDMALLTNMLVNGDFTSAATDNLTFGKTSTVTYDGGTEILATTDANSFGNLTLLNAAKTHLADIYIDNDFSLSDANLAMGTTYSLVMTDIAGTPTYEGVFEVTGNMARVMTGAETQGTPLTFNNSATTITLTEQGSLSLLTLNVTPGDALYFDYDNTTDVRRSIKLTPSPADNDWTLAMNYGYLYSELDGFDAAQLRFREGISAGVSEKIATGQPITNRVAATDDATWSSLSLAGIQPLGYNTPVKLSEVADGNPIFLRSGPVTFITIADGRWSNPNTWDEGMQPASTDNTEVLHTVHVGFQGGSDKNDLINGIIDERSNLAGAANQLAQTILIRNVDGASLVFGDNPSPDLPAYNSSAQNWAMNTAGIITNLNTTANTVLANLDLTELNTFINTTTGGTYQGLILFDDGTPATKPISLSTQQLINTGGEVNVGPNTVLQICQTP